MTRTAVDCPVNPSEDPEKVKAAILRLFPTAELSDEGGRFRGEADLEAFSKLIRKQKILDSTRGMLFKGKHGDKTVILLNKQVATVGKVSFAEPHAVLGAIKVTIEDDDLEALIDRIAPETVDGEEVPR